jgi:hypothetical protein
MATTTPNYGWDVPTSTDYVKDGATAIETLGDDIDATLYSVTGGKGVGLQFIAAASITAGTVSNFNNVFTSAYDNYRIIIAGKAVSSSATITYQNLLATVPAATNYRYSSWYAVGATSGVNHFSAGTTSAILGYLTTGSDDFIVMDFANPALAKMTNGNTQINYGDATMTVGSVLHTTATAYDGFRITSSQNVNATIKVYGYRNS